MTTPDPLTPEEIAWLRKARAEAEHERWLFQKFKVIWPWVVAVVSFLVFVVDWLKSNITFK